jgi:hypothetical protein
MIQSYSSHLLFKYLLFFSYWNNLFLGFTLLLNVVNKLPIPHFLIHMAGELSSIPLDLFCMCGQAVLQSALTVGGTWYTDTAFANVKSIRGMKCL